METYSTALMDCRLFGQTPVSVAAVIDAFLMAVPLQITVGHIRPRLAPLHKLFLTVPTLGNGILPAVLRAFRVLTGPFIPVLLSFRWWHIHLFAPDLVGVGYCFSQPSACAAFNSAAVNPFSSLSRTQRYSFSVLYCHLPCPSNGRTVSRIWAWGLWPGGCGS